MAYDGYEVPLAIGSLGLHTDGPQSQLSPNAAIVANNVSFFTGTVSKSPGTARYNSSALSAAIVAAFDWWPTPTQQRMIALTSDGKVWQDTGDGSFSSNVPLSVNETQYLTFSGVPASGSITFKWNGNAATTSNTWADSASQVQASLRTIAGLSTATVTGSYVDGTPGVVTGFTVVIPGTTASQPLITTSANTLQTSGSAAITMTVTHLLAGNTALGLQTTDTILVAGGAEVANNPRRLFIFSSSTQLAMITGAASQVTAISRPANDWVGANPKYPTCGVIYNSRLVAVAGHNLYFSRQGDHTDFTSAQTDGTEAAVFPIFPGEGDAIIGCIVYKGALFVWKRPQGLYIFTWTGGSLLDPTQTSIQKLSDQFSAPSPHAAITMLDDLMGGSNSGSIFSQKAVNATGDFAGGDMLLLAQVRNYFRQNFAYGGLPFMQAVFYPEKVLGMFSGRDAISSPQNRLLMYDNAGQSARISVETKDQPTCLFTRKDQNYVLRPFYGANDGYVYQMDQSAANVNGTAYTGEFQTPYVDFSYLDPKLADKVKLFEFLSVTYQNLGNWSFYVDVSVDGTFIQTLQFQMKQSKGTLDNFTLGTDVMGTPNAVLTLRKPLKSCSGKSISLRVYNSVLNQSFTIERLIVSFRESGEQYRSSK